VRRSVVLFLVGAALLQLARSGARLQKGRLRREVKRRRQHAGDERRRQAHGHDAPPRLVRAQSSPLNVDLAESRRRSATHCDKDCE
jgi:hypothetical protein